MLAFPLKLNQDRRQHIPGSNNPGVPNRGAVRAMPMENVRQFLRDNWLSNCVFRSGNDIVGH